jgi:mono/diheme cytochrome c family protein
MRVGRTILILTMIGLPLLAQAESMPQQEKIANGKMLSQKLCSACHVVDGSGGGSDAAPSFSKVATTRGDDFLHTWLMKPHGNMPPVDLTNAQIDALVTYIDSLRK